MKRIFTRTVFAIIILLPSCHVLMPLRFMKMKLMDHKKMPSVTIHKSDKPFLYQSPNQEHYKNVTEWLDSNLVNTRTSAYLVIKNDSIVYERYFDGFDANTLFSSFSVIKSFIGTLTGIAIQEGKIKSLNDPMTNYLPEFLKKDIRFKSISIQHLLDMHSGIRWNEGNYDLNDDAVKMGFSSNIMKRVMDIEIETEPENDNSYKSINTLLLGLIITRATDRPLVQYFEEKLWKPMGAEHDATLTTDRKKLPITYVGLNATARDFAKLGTLYLKKGIINQKQVITPAWINASVNVDSMHAHGGYRNHWWSGYVSGHHLFIAQGILGQFVYIMPDKNLIVVRMGHFWQHPTMYVQELLKQTALRY